MRLVVGTAVAVFALAWLPSDSFGQDTDVAVSGIGLVSIQPTDEAYIGSPYLNVGLGGVGPGWGSGVSVMTSRGLVVAGEFTTAYFDAMQAGRLVGGSGANEGVLHPSRWSAHMISGLVGYAARADRTDLVVLGGIGKSLGAPSIDDRESEADGGLGFTGGIDVVQRFRARGALLVTARYSFIDRDNLQFLGIGPHVIRV